MPIVSDFLQLLREKVLDGHAQFTASLIAAVTMCCKVRVFVFVVDTVVIKTPAC